VKLLLGLLAAIAIAAAAPARAANPSLEQLQE